MAVNSSIVSVDTNDLVGETQNVYKTVSIMAKRANQISAELKKEIQSKMEAFAPASDNLEEIIENREQIEISKYYEALPKPNLLAIDEFTRGEVYFKDPYQGENP
jgi:DNA-directed RNA polymerase subunit K/omega